MLLPEVNLDYGKLYRMLFPPVRVRLLLTGIELKVFNHLSKPSSAEEVAKKLRTHPRNTKIFLDGLTAINLIQKKSKLYKNTPITQSFLIEGSETYLGELLSFMANMDISLQNLTKLVKEGPSSEGVALTAGGGGPPSSQEMFRKAAMMMANTQRAGDAQMAVGIVTKLPEFKSFQRMLDLGGGPGIIGMAIVSQHPEMNGVIFDLPPVVGIAEEFIEEYGLDERVKVLAGDFNRDSIGEGYDLVYTSNALQFAGDIDLVVKKVFDALNPDGVFVSLFGFGQTHEGTKPENLVLGLLSTELMGQAASFEQGYIANSMIRIGFKSVQSRIINTPWGPTDLDICRK